MLGVSRSVFRFTINGMITQHYRALAQFGSALRLGRRGQRFKSFMPDLRMVHTFSIDAVRLYRFNKMVAKWGISLVVKRMLCKHLSPVRLWYSPFAELVQWQNATLPRLMPSVQIRYSAPNGSIVKWSITPTCLVGIRDSNSRRVVGNRYADSIERCQT